MRILDACDELADYRDLGEIIGNDTGLSARVLALANSSYFGRGQPVKSLQQALMRLGMENLRTLVITASLRQFLLKLGGDQWQQLQDFWRHSLATALVAKALAHLTGYGNPDEAFLIGMLHNVGELLALHDQHQNHQPGALQATDTAAAGAAMAQDWGLSPLAIDAIRYQHLPPEDIRDTPHLVKIISLSTRLAMADKRGIDAAQTLFGLTAALTREICARITDEVESLAEGLGINLDDDGAGAQDARNAILERLIQRGMVDQVVHRWQRAEGEQSLCEGVASATELLSDGTAMVLLAEEHWLWAGAVSGWPDLDLRLPREPARSLVARCAETLSSQLVGNAENRQVDLVVDQQLLDLLAAQAAYATPIALSGTLYGVIVAGFTTTPAKRHCQLIDLLALRAAPAFQKLRSAPEANAFEGQAEFAEARLRMRQLVHEVSNPLTVIRNYLISLQERLSEDNAAKSDLDIVREELDRIATLLVQSRDLHEAPTSDDRVDLSREVQVLMELLESAFFNTHQIDCDVRLPSGPVPVAINCGALRQIILNLVRNAVEAMPDGGSLVVSVHSGVWQRGSLWAELTIEDNGPGLPDSVRNQLFAPVASTKGQGHSGLGLSIVKRLIDDTDSVISCYTDSTGTGFRILIPAAVSHEKATRRTD